MEKKTYWSGHRQRLKERARAFGWESLRPHEVIELILFYAVPRRDMSEIARNLVGALGSVHNVVYATRDRLMAVPGVTRNMADWILLTRELVDAYIPLNYAKRHKLVHYRDVLSFLMPRWRAVTPPSCWAIYTDYDDAVICCVEVCDSLAWNAPENTRRMLRQGLQTDASHMILVQYLGAQPLEMEEEEIAQLHEFALSLHNVEIELWDCVRVNEVDFYSMNVNGKLLPQTQDARQKALFERYARPDDGEERADDPDDDVEAEEPGDEAENI